MVTTMQPSPQVWKNAIVRSTILVIHAKILPKAITVGEMSPRRQTFSRTWWEKSCHASAMVEATLATKKPENAWYGSIDFQWNFQLIKQSLCRNVDTIPEENIVKSALRATLVIQMIHARPVPVQKLTRTLLAVVMFRHRVSHVIVRKDTRDHCVIDARRDSSGLLRNAADHAKAAIAT
jgi:hypothetical protein